MRVPLTLHQLEAFCRVAELRNFRKAAETLHVSQPALSRTIAGAEAALGTRLFDRDTRNVRPTPAAQELAPIARRVLGEFEFSLGELSRFVAGHRGRVVVATLPSVGASLLPPVMKAYAALYPEVDFVIRVMTTKPVLAAVEAGEADFGICMEPSLDSKFRYHHLVEDEFVLVCQAGHALTRKRSWGWDVFTRHPYIAQSAGTSIRMLTESMFETQGLAVHTACECESLPVSGKLIAANFGISALPRLALSHAEDSGIAVLELDGPRLQRRLGVVTRAGRSPSSAAANFLQMLKAHVAASGDAGAQKKKVRGQRAR